MSKKPMVMEIPLPERIAKARKEGRTQQALDLTRQLFKFNQTEENRELLRRVTLERGQQLQAQGATKDAVTVFGNLMALGGSPELIAAAAQGLAACGASAQALAALQQLADPELRQRVLRHMVDGAIAHGAAGKAGVPADLHTAFDLVLQSFRHYEAGHDDEARNSVQSIGLQSPFLEWKVLLRGLIAYHAKDDARAIENWQRLDPQRLPFRLSAPIRASIDRAFMQAQAPAVQSAFKTRMAQTEPASVAPTLRELRPLLAKESLAAAFRKAEPIVATMKRDNPDLASRLAQCFFWAILEHGEPDDIVRHTRLFGAPAEDPRNCRLEALALEAHGMWPEAHQAWQVFLQSIAASPQAWPSDAAARAQALVWARMADNALSHSHGQGRSDNPFFDMFARGHAPLRPNAQTCLENALKLVPDRLDTFRALIALHLSANKITKAKSIARRLLKRFPDHGETLVMLGNLSMQTGAYKHAEQFFEKAIHANPLERSLHELLAQARMQLALKYTIEGKFSEARKRFEKAQATSDRDRIPLLCLWAAAETRAGDQARADELFKQAREAPDSRLACQYALLGAAVRVGLPAPKKKPITAELKSAFAQVPSPREVLILLETAAFERDSHGQTFHGQLTHEKTMLKFLERIDLATFSEGELVRLCFDLESLEANKLWFKVLMHSRARFLKSAYFRLSFVDYYLRDGIRRPETHLAREHLTQARALVEAMPRGVEQENFFQRIKDLEEQIAELSAPHPSFTSFLDNMFGNDEDDFYDEEDDEYF